MEIRYEKHWSSYLNRDMEFKIYGSSGKPVMFIPCQAGRFWDFEDFHMADCWAPWIESGECMVFSVDTIDNEAWAAVGADNRWRIENHEKWFNYIVNEMVPTIRHLAGLANGYDQGILTFGASMGAMHGQTSITAGLTCSTAALPFPASTTTGFFGDYCDDLVYNNCPLPVFAEYACRPLVYGSVQPPEEPDRLRPGCLGRAFAGIHPVAGHGVLPEGHSHPV